MNQQEGTIGAVGAGLKRLAWERECAELKREVERVEDLMLELEDLVHELDRDLDEADIRGSGSPHERALALWEEKVEGIALEFKRRHGAGASNFAAHWILHGTATSFNCHPDFEPVQKELPPIIEVVRALGRELARFIGSIKINNAYG